MSLNSFLFKIYVRYITHDSYAISVMLTFNKLWAQINTVIATCLKSQRDMCLGYLTDDLSSWWESKLKGYEFKLLSICTLYICELIVSQLWVRKSVKYITHNSYAISVVLTFNNIEQLLFSLLLFLIVDEFILHQTCIITINMLFLQKL